MASACLRNAGVTPDGRGRSRPLVEGALWEQANLTTTPQPRWRGCPRYGRPSSLSAGMTFLTDISSRKSPSPTAPARVLESGQPVRGLTGSRASPRDEHRDMGDSSSTVRAGCDRGLNVRPRAAADLLSDSIRRDERGPRPAIDGRPSQPASALVSDRRAQDRAIHLEARVRTHSGRLARVSRNRTVEPHLGLGPTCQRARPSCVRSRAGDRAHPASGLERRQAVVVGHAPCLAHGRACGMDRQRQAHRKATADGWRHEVVRKEIRRRVRATAVPHTRRRSSAHLAAAVRATASAPGHPRRASKRADVSESRGSQTQRRVRRQSNPGAARRSAVREWPPLCRG